ncbi:acetylglutamate kinase [uncultured Parolsenella sp.]|uniref:acetylglutamate kinase n=1 Tax=uncultured Parolsenella sp. TaxID=2083008 RepID=UPI0027D97E1D|nr:acetylglutamate kinase [uncultured Parolsenella sp.]
MKFATETYGRAKLPDERAGQVLFEALPWIKNITGKTVVIKYGGSAMESAELRRDVMSDIVLLKILGVNVVIVHGGGKAINRAFDRLNFPVEFKNGQRVTTPEAMDVVRQVLVGEVNQDLVASINRHGNLAVGVSGADAGTLMCSTLDPELGRVGKIEQVNTGYLENLMKMDYIPVVATVGIGEDGGYYNVNADVAAGHVAAAIGAHKVIYLTDVNGVYLDFNDKETLISNMSLREMEAMLAKGDVDAGMIPKLQSCCYALHAGVFRSHVINGKIPHSLLLELLTDKGVGTTMHSTEEALEYDAHPLGTLAARLSVNN